MAGPPPSGTVTITLRRTGAVVARRAAIASSWRERMVGLLHHAKLAPGEALILPHCNAIHMVGMRFAIDAIFIDRSGKIMALKPGLKPGTVPLPVWTADTVIEAEIGTIQAHQLQLGDVVTLA